LSTINAAASELPSKALYRVTEVMAMLSMSRTVIYEQLRSGRLRSVTQGRRRLVPATAITEYLALLEHEATRDEYGRRAA
jgi:excisionase family DNA binding protein